MPADAAFAQWPTAVVTGATSAVAGFLVHRLKTQAAAVVAISRRPPEREQPWVQGDLNTLEFAAHVSTPCVLIHLAPIYVLPKLLESATRSGLLRRVVALSSTSVVTKADSPDPRDRKLVAVMTQAEARSREICESAGIGLTILRPTLIYGGDPPGGLERVRRVIRCLGLFPLAGTGAGLRQPVHAEDVAIACLQALCNDVTIGRSYNIGGGEVLSYREMLRRIFVAEGRRPRIVDLPVVMVRLVLRLLGFLPVLRGLNPAVADRMNQDMVFDIADAQRDFDFRPRRFSGNL